MILKSIFSEDPDLHLVQDLQSLKNTKNTKKSQPIATKKYIKEKRNEPQAPVKSGLLTASNGLNPIGSGTFVCKGFQDGPLLSKRWYLGKPSLSL